MSEPEANHPATVLPDFPWDTISDIKRRAAEHSHGIVDLSVGTPVDRVAVAVRSALAEFSDWPGYPQTRGTDELRTAYAAWMDRAHGVSIDSDHVLPTIGSKELVASLPLQLGLRRGDVVAIPHLAYPTYEVGARVAGADVLRVDMPGAITATGGLHGLEPGKLPALLWLNSPSNPTGATLDVDELRTIVRWARDHGVIVASDECYIDLGWETSPVSVLHPEVCGGDHTGLLAVHSLSKRCNLAGYRLGFISGDPALVAKLLELRKHMGLIVPGPIQAAGVAALADDAPVLVQRDRYAQRRDVLARALGAAGFEVADSPAGLYLWCTRGERDVDSLAWLAERGILVAPGHFYGPAGEQHIRVAFTATDERVAAAATRLAR